eukprot:3299364-Pleurochrysis_carterae.AAC.1
MKQDCCDAHGCPFEEQCMPSCFSVLQLRRCAMTAYGESVLNGQSPTIHNHAAVKIWFALVFSCRVVGRDGSIVSI